MLRTGVSWDYVCAGRKSRRPANLLCKALSEKTVLQSLFRPVREGKYLSRAGGSLYHIVKRKIRDNAKAESQKCRG